MLFSLGMYLILHGHVSKLTRHRLQEETAKVEEHLLDGPYDAPSFTDAIVKCFTISKANAFENLLEPLQKLLRLSPPMAATLVRPDLFPRIGQKLRHSKPAVRLNLLRIVSSICDSTSEQAGLLDRYGLLDAIRELQNDPAVLVRDLAGKLVKASEASSDTLSRSKRRTTLRRKSTSTTPPSLISNHSIPSTPQLSGPGQPKRLLEGRETPRHRNDINLPLGMRPGSRDGSGNGSSPAGYPAGNGMGAVKSRLPRTMAHRLSQQNVGSAQQEENRTPNQSSRPSLANPRRRRQTNIDTQWT